MSAMGIDLLKLNACIQQLDSTFFLDIIIKSSMTIVSLDGSSMIIEMYNEGNFIQNLRDVYF